MVPRLRDASGRVHAAVVWPKHTRSVPEFDFLRAQFCAWMSFAKALELLGYLYPVKAGRTLTTAHRTLARTGKAVDAAATQHGGTEAKIDADQMVLPLDTTFIRANRGTAPRQIEGLVGAVERERGRIAYFSAPASDPESCVRLGQNTLKAMGFSASTALVALTDGGRIVQCLARQMGAPAKPVTDWFHQSMRIQHVEAVAQAFPEPNRSLAASRRSILRKIERMRHRLWPTFGTNGRANALSKAERALKGELKTYRGDPRPES